MAIKTVIRLKNDGVMVFDTEGEQIPEYQGQYKNVREGILKDAPPDVVFSHWFNHADEPEIISKGNW